MSKKIKKTVTANTNMLGTIGTKTFNYSLTVNGLYDKQYPFIFSGDANYAQTVCAIQLIERIIGDVDNYLFMESDDIELEGEYYGFEERFSREYRHDITKADLTRLLVTIQNAILTFKHEDKKGE